MVHIWDNQCTILYLHHKTLYIYVPTSYILKNRVFVFTVFFLELLQIYVERSMYCK